MYSHLKTEVWKRSDDSCPRDVNLPAETIKETKCHCPRCWCPPAAGRLNGSHPQHENFTM